MAYSITADSIEPNKTIIIDGEVLFSRVSKLIEGDALEEENTRRRQYRLNPIDIEHTSLSISNAEVVFQDPQNPTREELFIQERRYHPKKDVTQPLCYNIDNRGSQLPPIMIPSKENPGQFTQDFSGQELAKGVKVRLLLRTYQPRGRTNIGTGLESIIVLQEPRYYGSSAVNTQALVAHGIVFDSAPVVIDAHAEQTAPTASTSGAAPVTASTPAAGAAAGASTGISTVTDGGYALPSAAPSQHQPQAQPQPQPQPQPQAQTPAPAPASPLAEETAEQKIQRLEAEAAQLRAAAAAQQGQSAPAAPADQSAGSAIGAPSANGPWNTPAQSESAEPGITYVP